ncbi:Hypothetical protein BN2458_PEG0043 [Helicobacter typhlonius]|uniref:Uncharacterized protein n=1 Tax=Helicobacter typhlonius TaxID=76936 RepID=A0A0S4PUN2_9HELI|nr:Hypothetical protein BN2458_PEG0043 [Helicobacter typhlonius]
MKNRKQKDSIMPPKILQVQNLTSKRFIKTATRPNLHP